MSSRPAFIFASSLRLSTVVLLSPSSFRWLFSTSLLCFLSCSRRYSNWKGSWTSHLNVPQLPGRIRYLILVIQHCVDGFCDPCLLAVTTVVWTTTVYIFFAIRKRMIFGMAVKIYFGKCFSRKTTMIKCNIPIFHCSALKWILYCLQYSKIWILHTSEK